MKNESMMMIGTLGSIILGFLASGFVYFTQKDKLDAGEKTIITSLLNFHITLFIVGFVLNIVLTFVLPFLTTIVSLVIMVANIYFCVTAYLAAKENKPFNAFTVYEFLK